MKKLIEGSAVESVIDLKSTRMALVPLLASLASAIFFLVLFGWLAEEVFEGEMRQFDFGIRSMVHQFATPLLTKIFQGLTLLGSPSVLSILFVIALASFLLANRRTPATWLIIAMSGALILDVTLKLAFHRARPDPFFGPAPKSYSFPSGHALGSFIFYGVVAGLVSDRIRSRPLRVLIWTAATLLVTAIGLSRIYLGVHYPTDVIAGYTAGAVWVSTLIFADRVHLRRASHRMPGR